MKELEELLVQLRDASRGSPVLVEGRRDVSSLRELGVEGRLYILNRGESIIERCEGLARLHPELILLTDWDAKGQELRRRLRSALEGAGARADDSLWLRMGRLLGPSCRTVEALPSLLEELERRAALES